MSARFNAIDSKVEDLAALRIYPIPSKAFAPAQAIRHGTTDVVVMIDRKGRIYSSQARRYTYWATTNRIASTIECLIRMGRLSAAAVAQHKAAEEEEALAQKRKYAARELIDAAAVLGIKLNATQTRVANKALPGGSKA